MTNQIFIIEDHVAFAQALGLILETSEDIQVCGTAHDIPEAIRLLPQSGADLVTLDINLPSGSGLDHLQELGACARFVPFLVISNEHFFPHARLAKAAGAAGYLSKGASIASIIEVVKIVLAGGHYFPEFPARL